MRPATQTTPKRIVNGSESIFIGASFGYMISVSLLSQQMLNLLKFPSVSFSQDSYISTVSAVFLKFNSIQINLNLFGKYENLNLSVTRSSKAEN
jgi:hypothetical protein